MKWTAGLLCLLFSTSAFAQSAIMQSGSVGQNNLGKFVNDHIIGTVGGITGDNRGWGASPFSITDGLGVGLCSDTAPTGGAYNSFCFGHDASGNAIWSTQALGGATDTSTFFNKNGVLYEIPFVGAGSGNVVGPNSSTVNR